MRFETYKEKAARESKEHRELVDRAKAFIKSHNTDEIMKTAKLVYDPKGCKITAQRDLEIASSYYNGAKARDLARKFNLSQQRISQITIKIAIMVMIHNMHKEPHKTA